MIRTGLVSSDFNGVLLGNKVYFERSLSRWYYSTIYTAIPVIGIPALFDTSGSEICCRDK